MLAAQLYPNPPPELEFLIKVNLDAYYQALGNSGSSCPQFFPYGIMDVRKITLDQDVWTRFKLGLKYSDV